MVEFRAVRVHLDDIHQMEVPMRRLISFATLAACFDRVVMPDGSVARRCVDRSQVEGVRVVSRRRKVKRDPAKLETLVTWEELGAPLADPLETAMAMHEMQLPEKL
jgi:hypothetical protein